MGKPIDANEARSGSACRAGRSLSAAPNLHGQAADSLRVEEPSTQFCRRLESEVLQMAGAASNTDYHPETTRGWPH